MFRMGLDTCGMWAARMGEYLSRQDLGVRGTLAFIGHLLCRDRYFDMHIMHLGRQGLLSGMGSTHAAWPRTDIREPVSSPA